MKRNSRPVVPAAVAAALGLAAKVSGRELLDKGLVLKLGTSPQAVWIAYQAAKQAGTNT